MICKVQKREHRTLFLTPGNIQVNLDKVIIEFIPIVGDWLELDLKDEGNGNTVDLSRDVIKVNRIFPIGHRIEEGKITSWGPLEETGSINQKIFFNQDSLSCGYIPIVDDSVVTEIIKSDQSMCNWRALKVLPSCISSKFRIQGTINQSTFEGSHPGLEISDKNLYFVNLRESKRFSIILTNRSTQNFKFLNVEVSENPSQITVSEYNPENEDIPPGESLVLSFRCTPKHMGSSNELLILNFEGFTIGKYININVDLNTTGGFYRKNYLSTYQYPSREGQVIRGQRNSSGHFTGPRLPEYPVPDCLLNLVIKWDEGRDELGLIEDLKIVEKSLFNDLNPIDYQQKFHTLLYMDEITNLINVRQYNQERTCFDQNGDFLTLEIENLAERRPTIVLGDRIMATNPTETTQVEYEGNVFKVAAKEVFLKFSRSFHDTYNGEEYSIKVVPGRSSYRRQHYAIDLVARNLGEEWLFPSKLIEKSPQITFSYDPYPKTLTNKNSTDDINDNTAKNGEPLTQDHTKKVSDVCDAPKNGKKDENISKLEWYNKLLNWKQKDAIINILNGVSRPLPYIIFGPPGTGKTVTVVETILQILKFMPESKILVTAPSNSAADLLALRLIDFGNLKPGYLVRFISMNYALGNHVPVKLEPYCATGGTAMEGTCGRNVLLENGMTYDCTKSVLERNKIIVSTCSSAGTLHMMGFPKGHFSHIFVDEAGQAAEPTVMIPMMFLDKNVGQVILAGDPMQLGPVVICQIANEYGLHQSFLERLINRFPYVRDKQGFPDTEGFDPRLVTKLLYNYRSLPVILKLFSTLFYNDDLIPTISNTDSAESKLLNTISPILPKTKNGYLPSIVFHGVEGENFQTSDSPSWYNPYEAAQVFYYVNELYKFGLTNGNIGIITPYNQQVREIRRCLLEADFNLPKIGTVEDFQGQEFDVIILSTVRSSRDYIPYDLNHTLGFVSSPRRLNVAISRPKVLLVIIGNPALLCYDTYWRTVIKYCVDNGVYTGCQFNNS